MAVVVEGNIGSGKTTLLQHFLDSANTEVFQEPVAKWRDIQGHNGLALMYEDPCRWSLTFQTYVQLTMLQTHTQPISAPVKLMERSIHSAKYCFVENLHESGKMPDIEYIVLTRWFDWILANENVNVDLISIIQLWRNLTVAPVLNTTLYLRTRPEVVHERIKKRCRREEEAIPMTYLQTLHDLHEDWLIHKKFPLPAPVMVLDGNSDAPEMHKIYEVNRKEILCGYT